MSSFQDTTRFGDTTHVYTHIHEETSQPKPRISIKADFEIVNEQSFGLLCCGTASRPDCSIEERKGLAKIIPITSKQESDHYRRHLDRRAESANIDGFTPITNIFKNRIPSKKKEEVAMKAYDWDTQINKLELAISKNFDTQTATTLTTDVDYLYIPQRNTLQLILKKTLAISEYNKSRLRQLIRDIYGNDTEIVTPRPKNQKATVVKTSQVQEKFEAANDKTEQKPVIEEVFERFIPVDEDELLKLADEIREKNKETRSSYQNNSFAFEALIAELAINKPEIFRC